MINMTLQNNNHKRSLVYVIEESEIRLVIWGLLNIYSELSFTEIAQKLGKSKSTLFPHIKELIDAGLIQVSKEKKVRGSILAKYYSIAPDALEKVILKEVDFSKGINEKISRNIMNASKSKLNYSKNILEIGIKFWETLEKLESSSRSREIIENLPTIKSADEIKYGRFNHTRFFLTEDQYRRWLELYFDLAIKFDLEISKEHAKNPNEDRPYYFFAFILPIKYYIESLGTEIL
ncbi:hypothetical protein AC481_00160 [miscellaneous Crenarchaeota group archaeon SMTZ-80]|nr:MAG: hypothetical protein AC481_00160 [miscellaneous Crenarchaeota group archaeon SMTZ-80]